jgi:hypothetical protein
VPREAIVTDAQGDDRYIVISSDCHGGGNVAEYRPYLDAKWRDEFDKWLSTFEMPYDDLKGDNGARNWDSDRRSRDLATDGQVGEIIFPNTIPPFFPKVSLTTQPPAMTAADMERRWAGLQAHNRWLVDFCNAKPGQRAGIVQITLHDIDASVEEIRWAHGAGLRGGVLLPGTPPGLGLPQLFDSCYDPLWRVCEELGMPVNHHTGSASPAMGPTDVDAVIFLLEVSWFAHRALTHLIVGGRARTSSRHAARVHRAGHRVGARRAGEARLLLRSHEQRRRIARAGVGPVGGRAVVAQAERVLGAPVPCGRELHPSCRSAAAGRGRCRSHHVGQRLPAQGVEPSVLA